MSLIELILFAFAAAFGLLAMLPRFLSAEQRERLPAFLRDLRLSGWLIFSLVVFVSVPVVKFLGNALVIFCLVLGPALLSLDYTSLFSELTTAFRYAVSVSFLCVFVLVFIRWILSRLADTPAEETNAVEEAATSSESSEEEETPPPSQESGNRSRGSGWRGGRKTYGKIYRGRPRI
ncbi:hypothetical protein V8F20_004351 [Naviculisporaceae sp. PSN 640]